jgi:AraC family transcriptional regulator, transcriptional activator FtrA
LQKYLRGESTASLAEPVGGDAEASGRILMIRDMSAKRRPLLAMLVADGLSLFEFSAACDVFGVDSDTGDDWYRFAIVSAKPSPVSTDVPGVTVGAEFGLSKLREAHTIIVPPSNLEDALFDDVAAELRRAHARGARLASLCTGAFILARAGLLNGREATTHWGSAQRLADQYPEISVNPDVLYIDDGDILTSAGSAASLDLCLYIVRKDLGAEIANVIARSMVVPPHRDGGQAQFVTRQIEGPFADDPFSELLVWAVEHLEEQLSVESLARRAAMSTRTFARRFHDVTGTTPHKWLISQRIFLAQRLLETTDLPIDAVAWKSGFGTATNLRLQFQKNSGIAPSAYRRTFRVAS